MLHLLCTLQTAGLRLVESRRDRDRGQTAAEYLGVIVVIAAIIGVLAASDIGQTLVDAINQAIANVAGA